LALPGEICDEQRVCFEIVLVDHVRGAGDLKGVDDGRSRDVVPLQTYVPCRTGAMECDELGQVLVGVIEIVQAVECKLVFFVEIIVHLAQVLIRGQRGDGWE
jgi:hypothetical protein